MIEKIRSLKDEKLFIQLAHPVAASIYRVNSINLIIGDNGTGKTKLIKSIIQDVVSDGPPTSFMLDGPTDSLGLIYYTAAPFYKPEKNASTKDKGVMFVDASPSQSSNQDFTTVAREYIEVAETLDIGDRLQSTRTFDFEYAASRIARSNFYHSQSASSKLTFSDDLVAVDKIDRQYRALEKNKRELQHQLRESSSQLSKTNKRASSTAKEELAKIEQQLASLNEKLEERAKLKINLTEKVVDQVLFNSGPQNSRQVAIWIAYCCILISKSNAISTVGRLIYTRNFDVLIDQKKMPQAWNELLETTRRFLEHLEKTSSGKIDWHKGSAEIKVDTAKLLNSNVDQSLINNAYRFGLLHIGFDQLSSGEAAVLHQLSSIAHAVHALAADGKLNILIFIDEGDLLLHLAWQRQYIELLDLRLGNLQKKLNLESIQIVIATHSPLLATDVLKSSVTQLGKAKEVHAFGAPLQKIVNYSFNTPSIGAVAEKTILLLRDKKKLSSADLKIIEQIDDDFVRSYLLQKLEK